MVHHPVFKKFLLMSMAATLVVSTAACSIPAGDSPINSAPYESTPTQTQNRQPSSPAATRLPDGKYSIQQATYDDIDGTYSLMLLNTPSGQPPVFQTDNLQMARLTDEELKAGEKSYLKVENGQPILYLTEDFRIEYVHNVTETQVNPQTGQQEVVVVRQEPSFWTPFAGALAGQAIGNLLFTPHYYFPPVYRPGVALTGFGGYGRTYNQAVERYQTRYNTAPNAVRNRQLRTAGRLQAPERRTGTRRLQPTQTNRPTGTGYGSSNLRRSNSPRYRAPRSLGGTRSRSGGFRMRRR